jgi:hypothetical protein
MHLPQCQVTLGSTVLTGELKSATIARLENGFDTATLELPDTMSTLYPLKVTNGTAFQLDVKDAGEAAYTTLSKGIVRFPILSLDKDETIQLKCDGAGYGLGDTVCAEEYGNQSRNSDVVNPDGDCTITEMLTDSNHGIITKWVNKILGGATNSGFSYDTTTIEEIDGDLSYLYFPYKPCNKCVDDACDLVTALNAGSAGPHWIVTTDDKIRLKLIGTNQTGWTKYYGGATNTDGQATLVQDVDFKGFNFEPIGPEANYIIYNGIWRRPSSGDLWTEAKASSWGHGTGNFTEDSTTYHAVGAKGLHIYTTGSNHIDSYYPSAPAGWDFSVFPEFLKPTLQVYAARDANTSDTFEFYVTLVDSNGYEMSTDINGAVPSTHGEWVHFEFPIGPYWRQNHTPNTWTLKDVGGTFNWGNVSYIKFTDGNPGSGDSSWWIDGLHFGGTQIIRIAKNSTNITANKVKMKTLTDNIGKDDTLTSGTIGTTDQGLMAQMAYAELLRLQKSAITGTVTISMLKDVLPGQLFHVHAKKKVDGTFNIDKDMRVTKLTHNISSSGYFTTLELTDDLTNSHPRPRYENRNKVTAATRPDYQDRQASSIKAGDIDIRVTPLEEDYPS